MMGTQLRNFLQLTRLGLVERLRLVFLLIVGVIGVAVAMALWQFKVLNDAQNNFVRTSVPVLVRSQLLERALFDLVISLGQIQAAQTRTALGPIEAAVEEQLSRVRVSVMGLERSKDHADQTEMILQQMVKMERGINESLVIKDGLFHSEATLERSLDLLASQRQNIRLIVEQLSFNASERIDAGISDVVANTDVNVDTLSQRLGDETRKMSLVTELSLELETIANVVGQLGKTVSPSKLSETQGFLQFRMRGVLQSIAQLPDTPARADLAVAIRSFRETIFGPQGILEQFNRYAERTRDLTAQNIAQQIVVREITVGTERLMASAHGQLTRAGLLTQVTTQRLILILAMAAIVVATIVVFSIWFIVERQINVRIGRLTGSVLRIAAGDTEHETQVTGLDELGRMAEALNIFKRNARELLRSNAELEKFAYAAAHDLRSPLQAIHDLTVWTIDDEENELSPDSAQNLQLLQSRVSRLSNLLGDLLHYARIGADLPEPMVLDLNTVVFETVKMVDPSNAFKVTHDWDGREIETYALPLQKILLNLMSNTVKHYDKGPGHIHISSTLKEDRLWVEYTDDGPGIDPKYHSKIFELFQTLKPRDEMEGSGLGLAITQKLVESFEGEISIRSDPETARGVTFIFDFPAAVAGNIAKAA